MRRSSFIWALIIVCWFLMGGVHLSADVYTWTDDKGVRHYSNIPPSDAEDTQVLFKEYEYDPNTDQRRFDMDQQQWKTLIDQIESDERKAAEASERRAEEARKNRQPSTAERAAEEKKRLEEQIAELEEKPLEYFGSYENKRVRRIYFQRRLEELVRDPEKYFNNPEPFRGVVKNTEQ